MLAELGSDGVQKPVVVKLTYAVISFLLITPPTLRGRNFLERLKLVISPVVRLKAQP